MIIRKEIDLNKPLTTAQKDLLIALEARPVTTDEDCPEITDIQIARFQKILATNREKRCKQTVTLRISPQSLRKAKSLGKGYTSVLSRILENALENPDIIERYL